MMTRTLQLDQVTFEIFADLEYRDEKGTLVAYAPNTDFANLRLSVTSIFKKGVEVFEVAEREIPELAKNGGGTCDVVGDKFVFRTKEASSEDPESTIFFWYVGLGGHIAVLSVFVDHRSAEDPRAKHVLACAELLVQSFRRIQSA